MKKLLARLFNSTRKETKLILVKNEKQTANLIFLRRSRDRPTLVYWWQKKPPKNKFCDATDWAQNVTIVVNKQSFEPYIQQGILWQYSNWSDSKTLYTRNDFQNWTVFYFYYNEDELFWLSWSQFKEFSMLVLMKDWKVMFITGE